MAEEGEVNWDLKSFIKTSNRKACLESLSDGPKTPKEISEERDIRIYHVSRSLSELREKELVKCETPDKNKNRIYRITKKGKRYLEL